MYGFFVFGDEYIGANTSLQMNQISCYAQQYSVNRYKEVVTFKPPLSARWIAKDFWIIVLAIPEHRLARNSRSLTRQER